MTKIKNPYVGIEGYNCFGCAPNNKSGLQMEFYEDKDEVISIWSPKDHFQGYGNVLHGGIQAALADELGSWAIFIKLQTAGVTSNINMTFYKPIYLNKGNLVLRSIIKSVDNNIAKVNIKIFDSNNNIKSEGNVSYFIFSEKIAKKRFYYPGKEAFFDKDCSTNT